MTDINWQEWLGKEGPLAQQLKNFQPREAQQKMAHAVYESIRNENHLMCEAPTGTGKSLGYLFPAILAEKRAIISTGTKHLQKQLFEKDLKLAKKTLNKPLAYSLLKGRRNYLCQYRIEQFGQEHKMLPSKKVYQDLLTVQQWAAETQTGDTSDLASVPEESETWQYATSTADNCLGRECPYYDNCFVVRARNRALESDIVVVNHHLLLSDIVVKDEGFGALLPKAESMIIDEAHQFPEVARVFFGKQFSSRQTMNLIQDTLLEQTTAAQDNEDLPELARVIEKQLKDARLAFGHDSKRNSWNAQASMQVPVLDELNESLLMFAEALDEQRVRSEGLERCASRAETLVNNFIDALPDDESSSLYWYETYSQSFMMHSTPMDIGDKFQRVLKEHGKHWVFTSATLSSRNSMDYFKQELGFANGSNSTGTHSTSVDSSQQVNVSDVQSLILDTPFNFKQQALLVSPRGMPDTFTREFDESFIELTKSVVHTSKGRCFVLCTSHRMLNQVAQAFAYNNELTVLVQGQQSRDQLLQRFRKEQPAILIGTSSFWEGVDVQGDDLSCVIIDRLPFASPDDPMVKAREAWLKQKNMQPFIHYSLPSAVIKLKQGVGRLIRSDQDKGVIIIADTRLITKNYGKVFLESLPDMSRTRDLTKIKAFLPLE